MKVICPNCGKLLEVSRDAQTCFCSECGSNFSQKTGIDELNKNYKSFQRDADVQINRFGDYKRAIEDYEDSLALKPNDFASISGIILVKLYSQSFDKPAFSEIEKIINSFDIYLNHENTFLYLCLIRDVIKQVTIFNEEGLERLRIDNKFRSKEYLDFYINGMKSALDALKFLNDNIEICDQEEVKEFIQDDDVITQLNATIDFIDKHINSDFEIADVHSEIDNLEVRYIPEETSAFKKIFSRFKK